MTTSNLPGRKPVRPPEDRLPPGQRLTDGWPVLTYG
ncbi:MAG: sulfite oxidase-like oxidoreductase, partial [Chloroflexi bacterium]|nr:sulfite oxidase-like oxidoreductase [Chloroflexota bacterium]